MTRDDNDSDDDKKRKRERKKRYAHHGIFLRQIRCTAYRPCQQTYLSRKSKSNIRRLPYNVYRKSACTVLFMQRLPSVVLCSLFFFRTRSRDSEWRPRNQSTCRERAKVGVHYRRALTAHHFRGQKHGAKSNAMDNTLVQIVLRSRLIVLDFGVQPRPGVRMQTRSGGRM
eukprot:2858954-Rhodomonas_salina.1